MKFFNHIMILSTLALGACSDSAPEPEVSPAACTLSIVLRQGEMGPSDAADTPGGTWGDQYDQSDYYTSESEIDNIQFFVRTKNGVIRALPSTLIPKVTEVTPGSAIKTYRAEIAINDDGVENRDGQLYFTGDIIAITNHTTVEDPFANNPFDISKVNLSPEAAPTGGHIPMWGIAHLDGLMLEKDKVVLAGDIYMLRSVPRITFMLHEDIKSQFRFRSITPDQTDYPATAYVYPNGGEGVNDTRRLFRETCFNPATATPTFVPNQFYTSTDGNRWWTYVAECSLPLVGDEPRSFTVTLEEIAETKDGKHRSFSGKVYLCDYSNGSPTFASPYDKLVRNHDYRFIIDLTPLDFSVEVKEWIPGGRFNIDFDIP